MQSAHARATASPEEAAEKTAEAAEHKAKAADTITAPQPLLYFYISMYR